MRASIVVAVRDQAELLFRCLSTLARLPDELDFEVVVVDDASEDGTPILLSAVEGDLQWLRNERPGGWGPACDQGVARAQGDCVVLLDAGLVPVDGWLEPLLAELERDPSISAVRPRIVDTGGGDLGGPLWPCLALRHTAYDRVGGFAGTARAGRAEKLTLVESLRTAGLDLAEVPASLLLAVPAELSSPTAALAAVA
jgi:glycosyltransferase involved in cell wall biosynthesis